MNNKLIEKSCILIVFIVSIVMFSGFEMTPTSSYQVKSLSADGTEIVTLDIVISSTGQASISKTIAPFSQTDIIQQSILGDGVNLNSSTAGNNAIITVNGIPSGQELYWVPIELDNPPIQNGGGSVTFYCIGSDRDANSTCDLSVMMSAPNIANLYCNNTRSGIRRLVSGWSGFGSADNGGGGVYIVASSVNYLN